MPKVSVIVCAYKSGEKILPTLHAILQQTFPSLEVIVVDDASNDGTADVIRAVPDERLRLVVNEDNVGVAASRNIGLTEAQGEYVAHCDHDDIWHPEKLERQVAYMDAHPEVGLLGTEFSLYLHGRHQQRERSPIYADRYFRWRLFVSSTFLHSTTMMRLSVLKTNQIFYIPEHRYADDWCLYHRCASVTKIAKLPEDLTQYHIHDQNWSIRANKAMNTNGAQMMHREINRLTGREYALADAQDYFSAVVSGQACAERATLLKVGHMLFEIYSALCQTYQPAEPELAQIRREVCERWWRITAASARTLGPASLAGYWSSDTPNWVRPSLVQMTKAFGKALIGRASVFGRP